MLNMQNASVGFIRSNCSRSGGQGNLEELKLSRRNETWPLCLAVCELPTGSLSKRWSSAKLYHTLVVVEFPAESLQ